MRKAWAAVVVLAACSSSNDATPTSTTQPPPSPVTLSPAAATVVPEPAPSDTSDTSAAPVTTTSPPSSSEPTTTTTLVIETDDGQVMVGGSLPDDIDPLAILPDDFELTIASSTESSTGVSGVSSLSIDDLVTFYVEQLTAVGADDVNAEQLSDSVARITTTVDDAAVSVVISSAPDGGSSIAIDVAR